MATRQETKALLRKSRSDLDGYIRAAQAAFQAGDYRACGVAARKAAASAVAARKAEDALPR